MKNSHMKKRKLRHLPQTLRHEQQPCEPYDSINNQRKNLHVNG